ncbi:hypothetical protein SEA_PHILLIS_40 [Mycobacterium phage Phillis]|nr:hypothetical protein SEA_PHILLIS_40 [Mycobacterium phage Phillis]
MRAFSSDEYNTAIRVLNGYSDVKHVGLVSTLSNKARKAKAEENYIKTLSALVDHRQLECSNGAKVFARLVQDGWTPPAWLGDS